MTAYRARVVRGHPFASANGKVLEHRLVTERSIGHPLHPKHVVHHVNGDGLDNRPCNLVVCEDQAYHILLHKRARALASCGNASWQRCKFCKKYEPPGVMRISRSNNDENYTHAECYRSAATRTRKRIAADPIRSAKSRSYHREWMARHSNKRKDAIA